MEDNKKTKAALLKEISKLRKRIQELEKTQNSVKLTKQRVTEENLKREKILLKALIDNIPDAIFAKDIEGRKLISNIADLRNMGCSSEEQALGKTDLDFFPKEIAEGFMANDHSVIDTGKSILKREEFFIDKDGNKRWLHTSKLPLKDDEGKIIGLIGIGRDITEQRQMQQTLQKERILLRTLIDNIPDAIFVKDLECRKTVANLADVKNMGLKSEADVLGKNDYELFSKEIADGFFADDQSVLKGNPVLNREEFFIDKKGNKSWLLTSKLPLYNEKKEIIGLIGIGRNITKQKLFEDALQHERNFLRTLIDNLPDLIYFKDNQARYMLNNRAHLLSLGAVKQEDIIGKTAFDFHPPELARDYYNDEMKVIQNSEALLNKEEVAVHKDTEEKVWHLTSKIPLIEDGKVIGLVCVSRNITQQKIAQEQLRETAEKFRLIFENAFDGMSIYEENSDPLKRRLVDCNPRYAEMAGRNKEELLKLGNTYNLQKPLNKEDSYSKTIAFRGTFSWIRPDAKENIIEYAAVPIKMQGKTYTIGIDRDVTEKRRAEEAIQEERNQLRTLIDNLPDLIFFKDVQGRYILNNLAHLNFIGVKSQEEACGKTVFDFHWNGKAEKYFIEEMQVIESGKPRLEEEQLIYHKTIGEKRWYLFSRIPLKNKEGKVKGILGVGHDITNRKHAEQAIRQAYDELEQTNKELIEANKIKGQFLANMSHEIRTPLNAVIGMTGLLLDTRLNDEQRDFAETIRSSGDILLSLINDILDFSKIEAQKIELEKQPFDVRNCIEEALDLVASKAADKKLELTYSIDEGLSTNVIGDVTRLRQIMVNLINNAIKFTEEGEVVVGVSGQLRDHNTYMLHFSVRDTGLGIPLDLQSRLFQSFTQVDASTTRKFGGTGLGLAISKQLSELMGGTMWLESSGIPGEGTTFHFTINTELSIGKEVRADMTALSGKRVLIVDDNKTNKNILVQQTKSLQMIPTGVESGPEALELLKTENQFDIAILDFHMPEMDGVMLAEKIRQLPQRASLPLILLSSFGYHLQNNLNLSCFVATLTKPIKFSQLHKALITVLKKKKSTVKKNHDINSIPFDSNIGKQYPLKILLAEDNKVNQKVALRFLEKLGYRVDVVSNGLEVLDALQRQFYEVILMDVQMPDMDGEQATIMIRKSFLPNEQPRIIAMTANAMASDREKYIASGMDDYIVKPFKLEELVRALIDSYIYLHPMEMSNREEMDSKPS